MDFSLGRGSNELVIDCSSSDLKVAVGNYNSKTGNITIEKMGVVPLEGDAINDGAVADSFGIVMAVKHAIARLGIRNKSCILTTEGAFVHTRDLELPVAKEDQLKDMVKYEVIGQGTNRDLSIDYIVYGTTKDEETNADKLKVRATAIPTDTIKDYREFLKEMELQPTALDMNPNAIRKLFSAVMLRRCSVWRTASSIWQEKSSLNVWFIFEIRRLCLQVQPLFYFPIQIICIRLNR